MVSSRDRGGVETQDYMINWNVGPLGLVLRPDLGADMPPVVAQVLPGESVASLAGVGVGDMLVSVNGKKCSKMGYEKAMKTLYKHKLPIILHFRIPQFKTLAAQEQQSNQASQFYAQQQNHNISHTPSPSSNPYYSPHPHGNASVSVPNSGSAQGYSHFQGQQPYPGQLVQYQQQQQQQYHQQQLQNQTAQQGYRSTSLSSGPPLSSGRGGRAFSSASTAVLESKEQKLRKQFSVTWVSGSLGFSFRPYAPGVNVPTVDLIGARGEGKNMELVCVNDVLIAINGNKTKDLGVERVLKMLHVLEKPVVLRFHKSSHRIETPMTKVRRKSSAKKLTAVVEREREVEKEYEEEEEKEEEEEEEGAQQQDHEEEEEEEQRNHHHHHQQRLEEEDDDEDDEQEVGDLEYEAMPSVRFALDDQIQLRSESRAAKPQVQGADHSRAGRVSARSHHSSFDEPKKEEPVAIASQFAKRIASSPNARSRTTIKNKPQPVPVPAPVPLPVPAAPAPASSPLLYNEQDLDDEFLEPDHELDESELPHVPISVAASAPLKRTTSSFTIPLEHAREIVAKSSGKPVAECQFGGKQLLQIQEGSVQARLLVTFAKACLAKQMKTARGENELPQKAQPPVQPKSQQPVPQPHYQPRASSSTSSEHRPSSANGGLPTPTPKPLPVPAPSAINVFAGNTLAPGKPKYLAYSFRQTPSTAAPAVQERRESNTFLSLPPTVSTEQAPQQQQQPRIFHFTENVHHANLETKPTSSDVVTDSNECTDQASEAKPSILSERETDASEELQEISTAPATMPERASEPGRVSAGGLTMSQLRVSSKLTTQDIDADLIEKFKDLGEVPVAEEQDDLPQRGTDMITLDSLLAMRAGESSVSGGVRRSSEATPVSTSSLSHDEEEKEEDELIPFKDEVLPESETVEPPKETAPAQVIEQVEKSTEEQVQFQNPEEKTTGEKVESPRQKALVGTIATADHPLIHRLCGESHDLETVMVGHTVEMIINKKRVVEEIQDILDSLEMELQFERHSFVSMGQVEDFAPQAKCSRCNRSGDASEMLLDRERRELYCPNCYDVFFYQDAASSMRNSSASSMVPPEFDTPTDFDPFEYSLHDSMVNLEEEFLPWRHLNSDAPSERDSNVTLASSITSHADEVWL